MFSAVINSVVPIFGVILIGWICAKTELLQPAATDALNRFVVYIALPSLLFIAMAKADLQAMAEVGFVVSFTVGTLITSLAYLFMSRRDDIEPLPRMINAMSASYANAGFMGIPLILLVFGESALPIAVIGAVLTVAVQFAVTIVVIETQRAKGTSLIPVLRKVSRSLLKNPILIGTVAGISVSAFNLELPIAINDLVDLLAKAATPCALFTIGLFLAQSDRPAQSPAIAQIVWLKLVVHPVSVGVLALFVFDLDPLWAWCAILTTALPVGTGPFMLANLYHRDPSVSARAILISTLLSVFSLTALIAWINLRQIA